MPPMGVCSPPSPPLRATPGLNRAFTVSEFHIREFTVFLQSFLAGLGSAGYCNKGRWSSDTFFSTDRCEQF